ncbi:formylglycine-generating enzyme family protein [Akkermansiaceae bacterium]|nr:formylglycine-generating enzyme family protein [Akkermansiaceae bacterium]
MKSLFFFSALLIATTASCKEGAPETTSDATLDATLAQLTKKVTTPAVAATDNAEDTKNISNKADEQTIKKASSEIPLYQPIPGNPQATKAPEGMIYIPGAEYTRGSEGKQDNGDIYPEEAPIHQASVSPFFMDETEVTNAEFKEFVDATGYVTFAEIGATKKEFPLAPESALTPGSSIFLPPSEKLDPHRTSPDRWWNFIQGANWKHPLGPTSSIENFMDHPVVCISYQDAEAYAKWAGKRLPTEAEWEFAARGGLDHKKYVWGDTRLPGKWMANCFQGSFPSKNTVEDGFLLSAPVKSYQANGYGLYDMAGNVWEICSDYYRPDYYKTFTKNPTSNPKGPASGITAMEVGQWRQTGNYTEPSESPQHLLTLRVAKGGSFLCHVEYCLRYRPSARHQHEPLTPTNHMGFRCVKDL